MPIRAVKRCLIHFLEFFKFAHKSTKGADFHQQSLAGTAAMFHRLSSHINVSIQAEKLPDTLNKGPCADSRSNYMVLKQHGGYEFCCEFLMVGIFCRKFMFNLCLHFRSNYVGVKQRGGIHVSFCDNMRQRDFDFSILSCDPIELQCEAICEGVAIEFVQCVLFAVMYALRLGVSGQR